MGMADFVVDGVASDSSDLTQVITAIEANWAIFAIALFAFFTFLSVSGLLIYHLNLIAHAMTTNEQIRGKFKDIDNPYDRGCLINYYRVLFTPRPPSRLHLRELIDP